MLTTGRGAAQDQTGDALRVVNCHLLGDHPAHRYAKDMGTRDAEGVEQANRIAGEQGDRIGGIWLVREPGTAVVVGDDFMSLAHFPDKHRVPGCGWRTQPHDEQKRLPLAFDLVVQIDTVDLSVWHSASSRLPFLQAARANRKWGQVLRETVAADVRRLVGA